MPLLASEGNSNVTASQARILVPMASVTEELLKRMAAGPVPSLPQRTGQQKSGQHANASARSAREIFMERMQACSMEKKSCAA